MMRALTLALAMTVPASAQDFPFVQAEGEDLLTNCLAVAEDPAACADVISRRGIARAHAQT